VHDRAGGMWRCPENIDWTSISLETPLPEKGVKTWDYFRRKLTISALRDEKKKENLLSESEKLGAERTRASFTADKNGFVNPFVPRSDDECHSMKSLSTVCDSYTLWDRNQFDFEPSKGEANSPIPQTPPYQDSSGDSCKNYFAVLQKWVADRKSWEKSEQSYQKRIRSVEERIREQKAIASARLQELKSAKKDAAKIRDAEQNLKSTALRITELQEQLRITTDQARALERRCDAYNSVNLDEEANNTLIAELQCKIGLAEEKLATARKNGHTEVEQKLQLTEKGIHEQNEKLKKLQLNCADLERNLNFETQRRIQQEETITKLTEEKITLKTEHQKFHLMNSELEALSARKEKQKVKDKELENAKLENIGLRKSNSVLTQRLEELERQSYLLKQKIQFRAKQEVSRTTCESQSNNRRTPISTLSSANQSTSISRGFESYGPYAMCQTRSVDPSTNTISISPTQDNSEINGRISEADVKFLKTLRVMMAKHELPLLEDRAKKPILSTQNEKPPPTVPKPRARANAKTKRSTNRRGKVKKTKSKLSCAPAVKSKLRQSGLSTRKAWCPA